MCESESEEHSESGFYYPEDAISVEAAGHNATDENQKNEAPAFQNSQEECLMPYNKLFINLACSVCTEKYPIFLGTDRASEVNKKLVI